MSTGWRGTLSSIRISSMALFSFRKGIGILAPATLIVFGWEIILNPKSSSTTWEVLAVKVPYLTPDRNIRSEFSSIWVSLAFCHKTFVIRWSSSASSFPRFDLTANGGSAEKWASIIVATQSSTELNPILVATCARVSLSWLGFSPLSSLSHSSQRLTKASCWAWTDSKRERTSFLALANKSSEARESVPFEGCSATCKLVIGSLLVSLIILDPSNLFANRVCAVFDDNLCIKL